MMRTRKARFARLRRSKRWRAAGFARPPPPGYMEAATVLPCDMSLPLPTKGILYLIRAFARKNLAERKGLEPSASGVTGRRYNRLNYRSAEQGGIPAFAGRLSAAPQTVRGKQ